jgi:chromosomal replication initiator protein
VHFLSTRSASQEEFLHTFNALQNSSRMLVVSSDAHPKDQVKIQQQLRDRFGGGLVLNLSLPDFTTRREILISKLKRMVPNAKLTPEWLRIVDAVAQNDYANVREYEGALNKVIFSFQESMRNGEPNMDSINALFENSRKKWSVEECFSRVSRLLKVTEEELKSHKRNKKIAGARGVLILLIRDKVGLPLKEVGRLLGGRAHTSILEMENKFRQLCQDNEEWRKIWESLLDSNR